MTLTPLDVCLRPERPGDIGSIRQVNLEAFERASEADLVDSLRAAGAATLSAVVMLGANRIGNANIPPSKLSRLYTGETYGGELVGHVLLTRATVSTDKGDVPILALGPVAVLPAEQRKGLGTMMISGCLEHLRTRGHLGVVVIGALGFFRRFGFIEAERWGLQSEWGITGKDFLALELTPGALGGVSGVVRYHPAFGPLWGETQSETETAARS